MSVFKGFLAAAACQDSHTQQSVCNIALHPCFMLLLHRVCYCCIGSVTQYEAMASDTCVKTAECSAALHKCLQHALHAYFFMLQDS